MGLTYINPLSVSGKNGLSLTIGPAPFTLSVISIIWLKGKETGALQTRTKWSFTLLNLLSPASSKPFWQNGYKNRGLNVLIFFPRSYVTWWKQNVIYHTGLFYMSFPLSGCRFESCYFRPGRQLSANLYWETALRLTYCWGTANGGRHSSIQITKTQCRKCGMLLGKYKPKMLRKNDAYWGLKECYGRGGFWLGLEGQGEKSSNATSEPEISSGNTDSTREGARNNG